MQTSSRPLVIYRSSAGSGKTYTLTREYLRLALGSPGRFGYRKILAVTFTNKAMQEMKDRIVRQLAEFSRGERNTMGDQLCREMGFTEEEFKQRCDQLLSEILHDYGHFSITTIDAFFQRVIRGFARELGVAGTYRLELQPDLTIAEVIHELMIRVQDDPTLLSWITDFSMSQLDEGKGWDVESKLIDYAGGIIKEDFQSIQPEIIHKGQKEVEELHEDLKKIIRSFENFMLANAREGLKLMDTYGITPKDFFWGQAGVGNYFVKILEGSFEPAKRVRTAIQNDVYTKSKSESNEQVLLALNDGLRSIYEECLTYWDEKSAAYLTAQRVAKQIYVFGISLDILDQLDKYKADHDLMFISDATRFLTELVADTDAPFIFEKIGSYYDHFLMDEFQDTSLFQWKSFRPLIENSLAEGHINLIVGDVKQSIYRWRGGDLELLQQGIEQQIGREYITHESLRSNFRSEPTIIRFNNAVFKKFASLLKASYDRHGSTGSHIEEVYHDVIQAIRPELETGNGGYVRAVFFPKGQSREDDWKVEVDRQLPKLIEQLQDKGIPLKKIAILVRGNKEGSRIAGLLQEYAQQHPDPDYRYDVVSNDSLFLSGSTALQVIVAALRFIQSPRDRINRAALLYHYRILNELPVDGKWNPFLAVIDDDLFLSLLPERFIRHLEEWHSLPFIVLIERLIHAFGLSRLHREFAYLQTFQDQVLQFVSREKGDLSSFLEWWELNAGKESIKVPDDLDAIRIMTIHKSKGLEFYSVIMPYVDWSVDNQKSPMVWFSSEESPYKGGRVPVSYNKNLDPTSFSEQYHQERLKFYVDNLNLLYVGFTRAVHDLWIFSREAAKDKKNTSTAAVSEILQNTLESGTFPYASNWDKETRVFEMGDPDFRFASEETELSPPVRLKSFSENHWPDKLTIKEPVLRLLREEQQIKIDTGKLIHRLLAEVHYSTDLDRIISELSWEEGLRTEQVELLVSHIRKAFEDPVIADWFDMRWKVHTESAILTKESIYRPDRVITDGREWVVIDFKTGIMDFKDQRQVKNYMQLVAQLEPLPVRGFLWYIDENKVVEV